MIARNDVTGIVLAGGRGRRMAGQDKGWLTLAGRPLIEHALAQLAPQVGGLVVSANRHLERYRRLGVAVATDPLPGFPGPLTGVLGAMRLVSTPWVMTMPVDMPWLPADTLYRLGQAIDDADIAIAHDGERRQPLVALLRTSLQEDLAQWLTQGGGKVIRWYDRHRWCQADFADVGERFANLNTPEERERAELEYGRKGDSDDA